MDRIGREINRIRPALFSSTPASSPKMPRLVRLCDHLFTARRSHKRSFKACDEGRGICVRLLIYNNNNILLFWVWLFTGIPRKPGDKKWKLIFFFKFFNFYPRASFAFTFYLFFYTGLKSEFRKFFTLWTKNLHL